MMLKATHAVEGGRRIVYCEASNEGLDQQNEVVAAKALAESAEYFKRYGNIDIDHYTLLGKPNPAKGWPGIPSSDMYEIGRPIEVRQSGKSTFVKAEIYSGTGPAAQRANEFWSSLVDVNPPQRWYPSVGGAVDKDSTKIVIDPETKLRKAIVQKVRWTNIGFSKTPVNQHVPTCATAPIGAFSKCWTAAGLDWSKALEAGYGTDVAKLTGGAALGRQSLDRGVANYFDFRDRLAGAIRKKAAGENPDAHALVMYAANQFGLSLDEASEYVERFMRDLKTSLNKRSKS